MVLKHVLTACLTGILSISVLMAWAQVADGPDPSRPFTLTRAIEMALERNATLRAAQKGIEVEDRGLSMARRQRIPRLDIFGSYQAFPTDSRLPTREREFLALEEQEFSDLNDQLAAGGIRASVPLFTGGRISAEIRSGEHATAIAMQQFYQSRDDLILQVAGVFYKILELQKLKEADEVAVGNLVESKRIVEKFVEVGKAPKLDLLRIETRLAHVRQGLIRVNNAITVANARLKTLMGLEGVAPRIAIEGRLAYQAWPLDLQQNIQQALERQPSYLSQKEKVKLLEQKVRVAQSERLPQVMASGDYIAVHGFESDRTYEATEAMVSLSMPVFDGALIRNRIAREHAELDKARSELEALRLSVMFEVQKAYQYLLEAEEQVKNTEVGLGSAREGFRIEQVKLDAGKGIVNDVLDAQADLLKAEGNYAEALADIRVAYVTLKWAIGAIDLIDLQEEGIQP